MASGGNAIRGSRVGSSVSLGESYMVQAEKSEVQYWCGNGHTFVRSYLATVAREDIPAELDCPHCGQVAGQDKEHPPSAHTTEPYKTHLAYVLERRTPEEAEELLQEALDKLRARRAKALAETRRDGE